MLGNLIGPELKEMIQERKLNELRTILCEFPSSDIAEILTDIDPGNEAVLLRILPHDIAAEVFDRLSIDDQEKMLHALGNEKVAQILNDLPPDDRTALLEEMPAAATQKLLNLLSEEERKVAVNLLGYPRDSIGRRMTPQYVAIQEQWTAEQVLQHLRKVGKDRETLNQMYVVDKQGKLIAFARLHDVVLADPQTSVSELLERRFFALQASNDQETAVAAFKKYDRTTLPVLDSDGILVGVVTVDDVLDVAEKETTEDIQKMAGMEALDAPYLKIGIFSMIKKRAGWLTILFVGEMFTATAMAYFEDEIAKAVVLALFVPLIISSGGNSGSQASSLIIRAMAVKDISLKDWWQVFCRELIAGTALGCVLAIIAVIRIFAWPHRAEIYGPHYGMIAATVAFSLVGVVLFGSLTGSMLPFILRRLGFDPAVSSAPFVATLVDVTGLIIYFSIAYLILHGTLL